MPIVRVEIRQVTSGRLREICVAIGENHVYLEPGEKVTLCPRLSEAFLQMISVSGPQATVRVVGAGLEPGRFAVAEGQTLNIDLGT